MNTRKGFAFVDQVLKRARRYTESNEYASSDVDEAIKTLRDLETELRSVRADNRRLKRFRHEVKTAMAHFNKKLKEGF